MEYSEIRSEISTMSARLVVLHGEMAKVLADTRETARKNPYAYRQEIADALKVLGLISSAEASLHKVEEMPRREIYL